MLAREAGSVVWNGKARGKKRCLVLERLLTDMIRKHNKFDYCRSIQRFCPLGRAYERRGKTPLELASVSKMFVPLEGIKSFLRDCVLNVCPKEIFGSKDNWDLVISGVDMFAGARTSEGFDARKVAEGIKTTSITWLSTAHKATSAQRNLANVRLQNAVQFLYTGFLIPLIRACFYVTETEWGHNECFWYRKPVWSLFRSLSMAKFEKAQYEKIGEQEVDDKLKDGLMGPGGLRLKPKETGVRGLVTLSKLRGVRGKVYRGWEAKQKSTNHVLGPTHQVLKYEHSVEEGLFGYGVQNFKEVFDKMMDFKLGQGGGGGSR